MKYTHKTVSMRGAFTLVELLVVITILILLSAIMVPAFQRGIELARRAKCKSNVKGIAEACGLYMNDPSMHRESAVGNGLPRSDPAPTTGNWSTSNPASLWLLVRYKLVGRDSFLCPSAAVYRVDGTFIAPMAQDDGFSENLKSAFSKGKETLSYSYLSQAPFTDGNPDAAENGAEDVEITGSSSFGLKASELAIIADANPVSGDASDNSLNHRSVREVGGQNVAFMDGRAAWFTSPVIPGTNPLSSKNTPDNIYQSCVPGSGTRGAINDAFLIP
jgi:type II secretory pathway pseudopilin PulG